MQRKLKFIVPREYDGSKLIHFLRGSAKVSVRTVNSIKWLPDGMLLNGEKARTIDRIHEGDSVEICIPGDISAPEPSQAHIDILYEDDDILAINKSPFMAIHPSHNHQGDTLANAVSGYLAQKGRFASFRAVGRLDKGTSGIVLCALNRYAAAKLPHSTKKEYLAIASALLEGDGVIDAPICRPDPMKTLRACGEGGERAVTRWQCIACSDERSLLRVTLETGRTHQIRVHFAHIGAPLVGDSMYGSDPEGYGHQLLHCAKSEFIHPVSGEKITLEAPPPPDFLRCCEGMKRL